MVSVIITTYNRETSTVMRALQSVLNQTISDYEVIIVNDCPENKTLVEELKKGIKQIDKDSRVKYVVNKKNSGSNYSRNVGIKMAKGEFISLLDDDDIWYPNKLEVELKKMNNTEVGLVASSYFFIEENGKKCDVFVPISPKKNVRKLVLGSNCIGSTSFPLIRKSFLDKVGYFDLNVISGQEYDVWIKLLQICKYDAVFEPLGEYVISSDSIFKSMDKKIKSIENRIKKYNDLYKNNKVQLNQMYNLLSYRLFISHQFSKALKTKFIAIKTCFYSKYNFVIINKIIGKIKKKFVFLTYINKYSK